MSKDTELKLDVQEVHIELDGDVSAKVLEEVTVLTGVFDRLIAIAQSLDGVSRNGKHTLDGAISFMSQVMLEGALLSIGSSIVSETMHELDRVPEAAVDNEVVFRAGREALLTHKAARKRLLSAFPEVIKSSAQHVATSGSDLEMVSSALSTEVLKQMLKEAKALRGKDSAAAMKRFTELDERLNTQALSPEEMQEYVDLGKQLT